MSVDVGELDRTIASLRAEVGRLTAERDAAIKRVAELEGALRDLLACSAAYLTDEGSWDDLLHVHAEAALALGLTGEQK